MLDIQSNNSEKLFFKKKKIIHPSIAHIYLVKYWGEKGKISTMVFYKDIVNKLAESSKWFPVLP